VSDRPIHWAIVGTGRMADVFARELSALRSDGAILGAVVSRDITTARDFAGRHEIPQAYGSVTHLAAQADIDAVYIASPPSAHAEHARACIEARKAVLCEKPFTINASEARGLIALARSQGTFLMEAMWTRFLPNVVALRSALREKIIGDIQLIIAGGAFIPACTPDHYLLNRTLGGGALLDAGVYLLSLVSMILGGAVRIFASGEIGAHGVDEHDALLVDYSGGAKALLYVSLRARRMPDMEILGTRGRILVRGPIFNPSAFIVTDADGAQSQHELPHRGSGYGYQIVEVMQCLRAERNESGVMPLDETLSIMQTMDEVRRQLGLRYTADN
jgi:predicted dehydrogenase